MIHPDAVNKFVSRRKNLILNGDFKISQRGDYTSATPLSSAWQYCLDRFKFRLNVISGTLTHKEDQAVDSGIVDSIKLVATSTGSGYINALQMVEDIGLLKGRVVTISAWVKSDNSNAKLVVNMDGANVQFNSSLHTGGGSWELLKGTYTVPTSITTFNIYCGILANVTGNVPITSGDFVEITQVQLELGSVATDFEHRSYGEELALCQRYFYNIFHNTTNKLMFPITFLSGTGNSGWTTFMVPYPVPMRIFTTFTHSMTDAKCQGAALTNGSDTWTFYKQNQAYANKQGNGSSANFGGGGTDFASIGTYYVSPTNSNASHIIIASGTTFNFDAEL
jgi:hypothetical protein